MVSIFVHLGISRFDLFSEMVIELIIVVMTRSEYCQWGEGQEKRFCF